MRGITGKLYQRVGLLAVSFILAVSSLSVVAPFYLNQVAHATDLATFNYTYSNGSISATGTLTGTPIGTLGEYNITSGSINLTGAPSLLDGTGTLVSNPPYAFEVGGGTTLNGLDNLLLPSSNPKLTTTGGLAFLMSSGLGVGIGGNGPGDYWIFGGNWALNKNGGSFNATALSNDATVTSTTYTVGVDTIIDVPFGTSKAIFLAALAKGESHQAWIDNGIDATVVSGNTLVVTAEDGLTTRTYTATVNANPAPLAAPANLYFQFQNDGAPLSTNTLNIKAKPGNNNLELLWNAPVGTVSGYHIYKTYPDGTSDLGYQGSNTNAWLMYNGFGEHGNGPYTYQLAAVDSLGHESILSSVTTLYYDTAPPAAALVTAPINGSFVNGTFHVSATASDNVGLRDVAFDVRSRDGAKWVTGCAGSDNLLYSGANKTDAALNCYIDTSSLADGMTYMLRVHANDNAGYGNVNSEAVRYFTVNRQIPTEPTGLYAKFQYDSSNITSGNTLNVTTKPGGNTLELLWETPPSTDWVAGYHILTTNPDGSSLSYQGPNTNAWLAQFGNDFGQHGDGAYTYRVVAVNSNGESTASSTFTLNYDTTSPTVTVKPESIGKNGVYSNASFKLYDLNKVVSFSVNGGTERLLTPNVWSDANNIAIGVNGGVSGTNTITVKDIVGNATTYSFILDNTAPVGGLLTMKTKLFPAGFTVASPTNGVYAIASQLSITGVDVFDSLSVAATDTNLDTADVPVYIDGSVTSNGVMHYSAGVWSYANQVGVPVFGSGAHSLVATFSDLAGNTTKLTAKFTTDNTAPTITVKPESIGRNDIYSNVSFKLYDADGVKSISVNNGAEKVLTPNSWSDANNIAVGINGGMLGSNTITLEDLAGNTTTYAFTLDNIAPVGGLLTMKTNLHPDGLSVVSPDANGIYTIATPLSITGVDVFKSLSAVVTDSNLNITSVPVYIDGSTTANGEMVYDANSGVWNYENQTSRPDFGAGTHNFVATFYDLAGNATTLTARFTTDNTAPVIMYNGNTVSGNQFTPNITIDDNNSTFTWTSDPSNPAGVTFDNTLLTPQFTFTNSGTYKFTLTVTDALGNSNSQDVSFSYLAPIISAVRSLAMSPAVSSQQSTAGSNDNSASDDQGQVLGDQTTKPDTTDNSNSNNAAIKGASTTKDDTASIFGIAWYWWVVILAAAAAVIWWIITAMRRRDDQNA